METFAAYSSFLPFFFLSSCLPFYLSRLLLIFLLIVIFFLIFNYVSVCIYDAWIFLVQFLISPRSLIGYIFVMSFKSFFLYIKSNEIKIFFPCFWLPLFWFFDLIFKKGSLKNFITRKIYLLLFKSNNNKHNLVFMISSIFSFNKHFLTLWYLWI